MSSYESAVRISLPVNSDQSASIYKFAKGATTGIEVNDVAGGPCIGVIDSGDGDVAGKVVDVVVGGVAKVRAGAIQAAWINVQSDASGDAIVAATGDFSQGIALDAAAAVGDVIRVLLRPQGQLN